MKKYMMAGVIIVINSWLLLGCSNDQKSETDAPNQVEVENENIEKSDDFEADIDTFIEEVTKVNQELKSFSIESTIDTTQTLDRKSTRLNSSHVAISYAVFCLKKKKKK